MKTRPLALLSLAFALGVVGPLWGQATVPALSDAGQGTSAAEPGAYVTEGTNDFAGAGGISGWDLMPQNGYSPRYGCYPGNSRYLHRYPAFHGWQYRKPYNYRQLFDYPWHAGLHEPTSLFGYDVEEQTPDPLAKPVPSGSTQPSGVQRVSAANTAKAGETAAKRSIAELPQAGQRQRGNSTEVPRQQSAKRTLNKNTRTLTKNTGPKPKYQAAVTDGQQAVPVPKRVYQAGSSARDLDPADLQYLLEQTERRVSKEDARDRQEGNSNAFQRTDNAKEMPGGPQALNSNRALSGTLQALSTAMPVGSGDSEGIKVPAIAQQEQVPPQRGSNRLRSSAAKRDVSVATRQSQGWSLVRPATEGSMAASGVQDVTAPTGKLAIHVRPAGSDSQLPAAPIPSASGGSNAEKDATEAETDLSVRTEPASGTKLQPLPPHRQQDLKDSIPTDLPASKTRLTWKVKQRQDR